MRSLVRNGRGTRKPLVPCPGQWQLLSLFHRMTVLCGVKGQPDRVQQGWKTWLNDAERLLALQRTRNLIIQLPLRPSIKAPWNPWRHALPPPPPLSWLHQQHQQLLQQHRAEKVGDGAMDCQLPALPTVNKLNLLTGYFQSISREFHGYKTLWMRLELQILSPQRVYILMVTREVYGGCYGGWWLLFGDKAEYLSRSVQGRQTEVTEGFETGTWFFWVTWLGINRFSPLYGLIRPHRYL